MNTKLLSTWAAAIAACVVLACNTQAMGQSDGPGPISAANGAETKTAPAPAGPENAPETPPSPLTGSGEQFQTLLKALNVEGLLQNSLGNWVLFVLAVFLGLVAGKVCAATLTRFGQRFEKQQWPVWNLLVKDLVGPAKLALLTVGLTVGLNFLTGRSPGLVNWCNRTLLLLYSLSAFWYAFNLVSVVDLVLRRFTKKTPSALDDQVVPLIRKTLRIFVVVIGAMFVVDSVFDQDIGALLAGLGIAGLAVSLAAQDSLKNLFGSITILLDQPFQLGERIVFGGYDGTVEEIGFRSTKLRTPTGHLVTIPNSNIVNDPVENIGRRPSIRRTMDVTITYDTSHEKIERAVQILRDILEEPQLHEPIHQTINGNEYPPRVYFTDFNPDSLNIKVLYWFAPPAYWDFLEHGQKLNLRIFEEFEKAGIEFAFPTQTLYMAGDPKRELALKILGADITPSS